MVSKTPFDSFAFSLRDTLVDLPNLVQDASLPDLLKDILADILGGVILLDDQDRLIYINRKALAIVERMTQCSEETQPIPEEIMHIIKFMRGARREFSQQTWLNQSTIFVDCLTVFNIYARWIQGDDFSYNYLLLNMEDQNQFSQNIALEEARQMGLTSREQDVWLLYQANNTYKQIAETLNITPNTVKKHMKSILTKQRSSHAKAER